MQVFAIRHKPSQEFMPARMSRCGFGGWSYWREPNVTPHDTTPRIFPTKIAARNALTAWLAGCHVTHISKEGGWDEAQYDERELHVEAPKNYRLRGDMEIVTFNLVES